MVVGNGLLAQAFSPLHEDDEALIFASGVSNSLETDPRAFARERTLLLQARNRHPTSLMVYFGTCSVYDPDRRETPYVAHKLEMENILERARAPWMVLRLPLAIGPRRHGRTLAPFLYERISRGKRIEVWEHATRYPIDVEDALRIGRVFLRNRKQWNRRINVALRAFPVLQIVRVMEAIVGKPALFDLVPKGAHYPVQCPEVAALARELSLDFSEQYLERVLRKYFGDR